MKKVAVVLYEHFCMFEFCIALETLAFAKIPVVFFGKEKKAYRSEEGMLGVAEYTLEDLNVDEFDALLLTGFGGNEFDLDKDKRMIHIVQAFDRQNKVLAAISAGPVMLLNAGVLRGKAFMLGIPRTCIPDGEYPEEDMKLMMDGDECLRNFEVKYIREGHVLTSIAYGYREWAMEFGHMLGIETFPKTFGLS